MFDSRLQTITDQLLARNLQYQHPTLLWTAIALTRIDHPALYNRAIRLMLHCIHGYPYLFDAGRLRASSSTTGSLLFDVPELVQSRTDSVSDDKAQDFLRLPDSFWTYSEKWSPRFEGVQSYLLYALMSAESETTAIPLLYALMRVAWDGLVDTAPTRHMMTITAFLPCLYLQLAGEQSPDVGGIKLADVLAELGFLVGRVNQPLQQRFQVCVHPRPACYVVCDVYIACFRMVHVR